MNSLPPFPVDPVALDLLYDAVCIQPGAERTTLHDALDMLSQLGGSDIAAVESSGYIGDTPVDYMRDPRYHPNDAIAALIEEIRRLRVTLASSPVGMAG